ncbi:MAG: hypothetical protein ACM3N4_13605, partial [Nitrososphaerota archaeon]
MPYALLYANNRLFLAPCIDLRCAQPIANAALVHQIRKIELRRHAEAVTREVDMLGSADELS